MIEPPTSSAPITHREQRAGVPQVAVSHGPKASHTVRLQQPGPKVLIKPWLASAVDSPALIFKSHVACDCTYQAHVAKHVLFDLDGDARVAMRPLGTYILQKVGIFVQR